MSTTDLDRALARLSAVQLVIDEMAQRGAEYESDHSEEPGSSVHSMWARRLQAGIDTT